MFPDYRPWIWSPRHFLQVSLPSSKLTASSLLPGRLVDSSRVFSLVSYILRITDVGVKEGDSWGGKHNGTHYATQSHVFTLPPIRNGGGYIGSLFPVQTWDVVWPLTMLVTVLAGELLSVGWGPGDRFSLGCLRQPKQAQLSKALTHTHSLNTLLKGLYVLWLVTRVPVTVGQLVIMALLDVTTMLVRVTSRNGQILLKHQVRQVHSHW